MTAVSSISHTHTHTLGWDWLRSFMFWEQLALPASDERSASDGLRSENAPRRGCSFVAVSCVLAAFAAASGPCPETLQLQQDGCLPLVPHHRKHGWKHLCRFPQKQIVLGPSLTGELVLDGRRPGQEVPGQSTANTPACVLSVWSERAHVSVTEESEGWRRGVAPHTHTRTLIFFFGVPVSPSL